jgi:hypothetical protein
MPGIGWRNNYAHSGNNYVDLKHNCANYDKKKCAKPFIMIATRSGVLPQLLQQ